MAGKLTPYNIIKGLRYLRHFGPRAFINKLSERLEPEEVPYGPWYENYRPTDEELEGQKKARFKDPVTFSIAVPVFDPPEEYLRACIESVLAQTYPHWQLCLYNAGNPEGKAAQILAEYAAKDPRISVDNTGKNAGISENTNAAVRMAAGDWIGLLDHDDELSPAALFQAARFLEKHPAAEMLYTDEDKISADGKKHLQPNLKPDFDPDLLLANNYICHFLLLKKDLFERIGGFSSGYDGAQDYDLILRASEKALKIGHVPEILYHWRTHEQSTADNPMSKMYAYEAGKRAIEAHLVRCGAKGAVTLKKDLGFYRVQYPLQTKSLISIIIPNRNEKEALKKCIDSIRTKSTYDRYEILVVENNSTDPEIFAYYKELKSEERIRILTWKAPFNYSAINNFAVKEARGEYLLFLNNDTSVISPGWMEEMLGVCQRDGTGAVGARLYYPDNTYQHAGIVIGIGGVAGSMCVNMKRGYTGYMHRADLMWDMSAVTAACMLVKRAVFEGVGGFDEKLSVAFNDVDLCLRIGQTGNLIVYDPYAELYHYESKSRGREDTKEKVRRFQTEIERMRTRWTDLLIHGDPYYNKNMSLSKWNYSLKSGERMQ